MRNFQPFEGFEDQDSIPFNGFEGQYNIPFIDEWRQEEPDDIEFENQNSEDEDRDFMIDEENIIEDVEVDMEDCNLTIDREVEFNGCQSLGGQRNEDSDEEEDVEVIDNDEWDSLSDDSGDNMKRREMIKELGKQTLCSAGEVHKRQGGISHSQKNYKSKLTTVCDGTIVLNASEVGGPTSRKKVKGKDVHSDKVKCTWKLLAFRSSEQDYLFIKTYNQKHICLQTKKIRSCTTTVLSKRIMDQIKANPGLPVRALQEQLQSTYGVSISEEKAFRAKALAIKNFAGDYLQKTNEGTTVKIDVVSEPVVSSPTGQFKRIYVCLGPLKKGFKAGTFPGQILSTVGVDSNNGTYPLAMLLLKVKTLQVGNGFFRFLQKILTCIQIPTSPLSVIDRRFFIRHIYQNMRKLFKTTEYKEAILDMLLNNLCEVFNSKLYLMKRVCNVMKVLNKCQGPLTPTGTRLLEANTGLDSKYHARWNRGQKYQVKGPWNDQHVVDMEKKECNCIKWELIGIPCKNAIASVGELYTYVHKVYWLDTWKEMYSFKVEPIKGRAMWPKSDCPTTLVPPSHNKAIGMPKKKMKITIEERIEIQQRKRQANSRSQNDNETQSLSRKFLTVTCSKCKQKGHNARTCKAKDGH
uniref:SWIM-type domain-containing protein n=1 Tax=Lactuca sativa TaxID=4236 RepID=A0A9R1UF16_LACSA|nr:hypothetical protein LSAT_V11C900488930 [Lactuca sativa]